MLSYVCLLLMAEELLARIMNMRTNRHLRVGVEFEDGRYSVTGFVKNEFDNRFSVFTQS